MVSCHPGWTLTDGVEAAYGKNKSYLEVTANLIHFIKSTAVSTICFSSMNVLPAILLLLIDGFFLIIFPNISLGAKSHLNNVISICIAFEIHLAGSRGNHLALYGCCKGYSEWRILLGSHYTT